MTWLTLRLQRGELILLFAAAIGLFAAFATTYDEARIVNGIYSNDDCPVPLTTFPGGTSGCQIYPGEFTGELYRWVNASLTAFVVLPLIVAILLSIPLVQELHARTFRLAWTQSATRARWARSRIAVLLPVGLAITAGAIVLVRWWPFRPFGLWGTERVDGLGIVNIGWFVFAAGLIVAIGTVLRRPLIALVLGAIGYGLARLVFVSGIRPYLIPPHEADIPTSGFLGGNPWVVESWRMLPDGTRVNGEQIGTLCPQAFENARTQAQFDLIHGAYNACLDANGITTHYAYQPASRYWPLQFIETGLLTLLGLVLIGWSVWFWLRRLE